MKRKIKGLPWFGRTIYERYYECKYCNFKTIKTSKAIILFKHPFVIPFTTKMNHMRMIEEGHYDK